MTQREDKAAMIAPELVPGLALLPDLDFSIGLEPYRAGFAGMALPELPVALSAVACTERLVPGHESAPDVRVLVYDPPGPRPAPRPAVLHMHGGGFVIGVPEMNDAGNRAMALEHDCVVVSVDYRLAPEVTWRGSLSDNYSALAWLADPGSGLNIDPARIALAGESAGGGHAAMLALHVRDGQRGGGRLTPCFLLLDAPMLDDRTSTRDDPHPHTGNFVWTAEHNRFGWEALLGGTADDAAPIPARATDLAGLPPTFISVGALDLFLEENIEWVRHLTRAGVAAELHVLPGAYHGFGMAGDSPQASQLHALRSAALARAFWLPR